MTTTQSRHITLDALRGFAVMGILWVNVEAFGLPEMAFASPYIGTTGSASDIAAWAVSFIFFDGKMRAIFSLLFGASMMLIIERAEISGDRPALVHYARLFWLAIFGLLHFYLLWWGDILFLYAVSGAVIYLFRGWSGEALVKAGVIAYLSASVLMIIGAAGMLSLQNAAGQPGAAPDVVARYMKMIGELGISPQSLAEETALYRGSFIEIMMDKLTHQLSLPFRNLWLAPYETIPLMMLGMGLYKSGFLTGHTDRQLYVQIGIWGTLIGGLCFAAMTWLAVDQDFEIVLMMNITQGWSTLPRLMMTMGYVALLILLIRHFRGHPIIQRVAAAGRAAFSNYLGSTIFMTFIFYGWGLGYFGKIGRPDMILLVLVFWAIMLLWSQPWLIRFRYGPLEWLWRSLARGKWQAMLIDKKSQ